MKNILIIAFAFLLVACNKDSQSTSNGGYTNIDSTTCLNSLLKGKWKNMTTGDTIIVDSFINTYQLGYCSDGVNRVINSYAFCIRKDSIVKIQYKGKCKIYAPEEKLTYSLKNDTFRIIKGSFNDPLGIYTNIIDINFLKLK